MAIELCPHCQTRVFLGPDRTCPSCLAFVAEPDPAMVAAAQTESEGERASRPGAGNPYQSPAYATEKKDVPNSGQGMKGLAWILLSFEGRVPGRVFWCAMLGNTAVFYACVFLLVAVIGDVESPNVGVLYLALYAPMLWVSLAVSVKRWHDRDMSGWWILIGLVPVIGGIVAILQTGFLRGTVGDNRFGPDPT